MIAIIRDMSDDIGELAAALAKAQSEMTAAIRTEENPYFKSRYADLASVWDAIREPLTKNGLAVIQTMGEASDGYIKVITTLAHSSGQWIRGTLTMRPKKTDDPQAIGSLITYARRYALAAIAGVAPDDDDAETAMGRKEQPKRVEVVDLDSEVEGITEKQLKKLLALLGKHKIDKKLFKAWLYEKGKLGNKKSWKGLSKVDASKLLDKEIFEKSVKAYDKWARETIALVWARQQKGLVGKKLSKAEESDLLTLAKTRRIECDKEGELKAGHQCIYECPHLTECEKWEA